MKLREHAMTWIIAKTLGKVVVLARHVDDAMVHAFDNDDDLDGRKYDMELTRVEGFLNGRGWWL